MSKRIFLATTVFLLMIGLFNPLAQVRAQNINAPQVNINAKFQVVVAAQLTTNVDIYVDDAITFESGLNATKPLNASGFIVVTPGNHTIKLYQTGTTTPVGTPFTFNFPPGPQSLTSIALLADMTWITFTDVPTAPAPSQATARVINLSPNNDPVVVTVDGALPATFAAVAYKAAGVYLPFSATTHAISIPGSTAPILNRIFIDGNVYSIFIFWDASNSRPKILLSAEFSFIKNKTIYLPLLYK